MSPPGASEDHHSPSTFHENSAGSHSNTFPRPATSTEREQHHSSADAPRGAGMPASSFVLDDKRKDRANRSRNGETSGKFEGDISGGPAKEVARRIPERGSYWRDREAGGSTWRNTFDGADDWGHRDSRGSAWREKGREADNRWKRCETLRDTESLESKDWRIKDSRLTGKATGASRPADRWGCERGARDQMGFSDRRRGDGHVPSTQPAKTSRGEVWLVPETDEQKTLNRAMVHKCFSVDEILSTLYEARHPLAPSNLCTALAYCHKKHISPGDSRLGPLCDLLKEALVSTKLCFKTRDITTLASTLAKLQLPRGLSHDLHALIDPIVTLPDIAPALNPQELSTLSWAFAKLNPTAPHTQHLLLHLAPRTVLCLPDFTPIDIANTAVSYARADAFASHAELFAAVCRAATGAVHRFKSQDFGNVAWALATASKASWPDSVPHLGGRIEEQVASPRADLGAAQAFFRASARELCSSPWREPGDAAGGYNQRLLGTFNSQELANLAWAYGKACTEPEVRTNAVLAICTEVVAQVREPREWGSPQEACNLAIGFASACSKDARWRRKEFVVQLFERLASLATRHLASWTPQTLSNLAYAFCQVGVGSRIFEDERAIEAAFCQTPSTVDLALITFSFGQLRVHPHAELLQALARYANRLVGMDLCMVLWGLACAADPDKHLWKGKAGISQREVREVLEKLWGVALERPAESYTIPSLAMLQQVWLLHETEKLHLQALPLAWANQMQRAGTFKKEPCTSNEQHDVSQVLVRMGWENEEEYETREGLLLDMAQPQRQVAVEYHGPVHYNQTSDGHASLCVNGSTRMKQRLLAALGWKLIEIPYFEWSGLRTFEHRGLYLQRKFHDAGIQM
ncbi:hypothetical protein CYMTET_7389 [Cymbomonas tetramitiformis]|uniref:RAP domain-containing protein n=1 Tax=Cymbomonas tetramitiformis TaxID=36881 RepID=A0AAE0GVM2_9CHLO|nr:hypothetical protein CYMTET_7389 [Cymbomonas tetramitiformis]